MDMSTYTLEELEHVTSEYTLRNQVSAPRPCTRRAPSPASTAPEPAYILILLPRTPSPWLSPS